MKKETLCGKFLSCLHLSLFAKEPDGRVFYNNASVMSFVEFLFVMLNR